MPSATVRIAALLLTAVFNILAPISWHHAFADSLFAISSKWVIFDGEEKLKRFRAFAIEIRPDQKMEDYTNIFTAFCEDDTPYILFHLPDDPMYKGYREEKYIDVFIRSGEYFRDFKSERVDNDIYLDLYQEDFAPFVELFRGNPIDIRYGPNFDKVSIIKDETDIIDDNLPSSIEGSGHKIYSFNTVNDVYHACFRSRKYWIPIVDAECTDCDGPGEKTVQLVIRSKNDDDPTSEDQCKNIAKAFVSNLKDQGLKASAKCVNVDNVENFEPW